jgi:hypothetical protein
MTDVVFLAGDDWEGQHHAVMFRAQTDDEDLVVCLVPSETLRERFAALSADRESCLEAFRANRPRLEEIARRLIQAKRFEDDGSILIRTGAA